jgi:iron-sulfur cluster repair protein YtfE (RIC family)
VGGGSVRHHGEHYDISGAHPGPAPLHDVEIWLGAYKPRMLALTGAKADGWLPSMGYIELDELAARNAAIDSAALEAGRRPDEIRRLLNLNGPFGGARDWAEQLAELTLTTGMSTYILSVSSGDEVRRFADEIAPAVRDLVATGRGAVEAEGPVVVSEAPSVSASPTAPLAAVPTPDDGRRLSAEEPWDESTRPTAAPLDADREYTRQEQAAGQHLIDVHDYLRSELAQLRQLVEQVAAGNSSPNAVRSYINRMTIRQNNWTLGTFCETYCRTVTNHHMLEDRSVFPHLRRREADLAPVIDRLEYEHEQIHELLERVDQALVALVATEDGIDGVNHAMDLLTDTLLSHFSYEERELIAPLARHGFY